MSGFSAPRRFIYMTPVSNEDVLRILMKSRDRIAAAAWVVVRDAHAAEDIFQNVVIKGMTKETSFDSDGAVLSWAYITARRAAIDWVRRHRNESSAPSIELIQQLEAEWIEDHAREDHRTEVLRDCLRELPPKSSELLRLRYFDGLACGQVSERLGTGLDAIYQRLSRLHKALKDCVESRLAGAKAVDA